MRWFCAARGERQPLSLKLKIFLLVTAVGSLTLGLFGVAAVWRAGLAHENSVGQQNLKLAGVIAQMPEVRSGLAAPNPAAALQPLADAIRERTGVDLIVIFDMRGIRYTHYNPRYVNTLYEAADKERALRGEAFAIRCSCVGVQSVRGLAPVWGPDGSQVGVVVVGTFVNNVAAGARQLQAALGLSLVLSLGLAAGAAFWIAARIKRSLYGLEPWQIAALLRERETLLQSMHEGLVAVERTGRIAVMNSAARSIIGVHADPAGKPADDVVPDLRLTELLSAGASEQDEELVLGRRVVVCNRVPIRVDGHVVGGLVTFRDKTEVTRLAEQLTGVRRLAEALRAQNHEFLNKLQALAGLIHLESYDEALDFITHITRGRQAAMQQLLAHVHEPVTAGLLLGKLSEAQEKGIELVIAPDSRLHSLPPRFDGGAMVCVLGNLIENALEALAGQPPGRRRVEVRLREEDDHLFLGVSDTGSGVPSNLSGRLFRRGVSSKGAGRGLGLSLVMDRVRQAGGEIQVDRAPDGGARFTVRIPLPAAAAATAAGAG